MMTHLDSIEVKFVCQGNWSKFAVRVKIRVRLECTLRSKAVLLLLAASGE